MHIAAISGHVGALEYLLGRGAQLEAKDAQGLTALHFAAHGGQVGALEYLLDRGAQLEATSPQGHTALSLAMSGGKVEAIALLRGVMLARQILSDVKESNLPAGSLKVALSYLQKNV